ncbi:MAG: type IV secretion system protein VirB3 [Alphaproteobacteria bacterium]
MSQENITTDAVYLALTRPPMTMGVPMDFFGVNFILTGIGIILCTSLFAMFCVLMFISLPLHGIGLLATKKDPHWISVWKTKMEKTGFTTNQRFWKSNSYSP